MIILFMISMLMHISNPDPVELGKVHWMRNLDEAKTKSQRECKPILILFQEVPGCATCRNYGSEVLSQPLIVEAIESQFIPLAIFNNKGGHDGEVLRMYNEPSWNNPVVRIVDEKGKDIAARLNGNYSAAGLTNMMAGALIKVQGKVPLYLQLLTDELKAKQEGTETTTYSMHCFWTGEALFGNVNGVVATTAGWQNGKEVVKVEYNPSIVSKSQLDKISQQIRCRIETEGSFRNDATPKYYLANSKYKDIAMTELQKCRVNSALADGLNPDGFLSARQLAMK